MASITLSHILKTYGAGAKANTVIHDLNASIADGEFVVIVGPSGCGKSTLLRMVAGLEDISGGTISIGERVVNDLEPAERDIAMVFQNYALYPHMSVFDNMAYGLKIAKRPAEEIKARVDKAAGILELSHLLQRKPRELSGGQRQRVAMGRAIVRQPQVFLFDEPLSNLDAKLRVQMRTEIKELHQRLKTTTIYVTHDQIEAMTMADKIVVLRAGRIEQVGTPQALYEKPANVFVAGFIGSPRMNFIPAATARTAASLQAAVPAGAQQVGIRPEHFQVCEAGQGLALRVLGTEYLGAQRLLQGQLVDGTRVEWLIDGERSPQVGETLHITTRTDRLHAFDHNEQRLAQVNP